MPKISAGIYAKGRKLKAFVLFYVYKLLNQVLLIFNNSVDHKFDMRYSDGGINGRGEKVVIFFKEEDLL